MVVSDKRGQFSRDMREANRKRVYDFYQSRPEATQRVAAEALGLALVTVNQHVKAINAGWKPAPNGGWK